VELFCLLFCYTAAKVQLICALVLPRLQQGDAAGHQVPDVQRAHASTVFPRHHDNMSACAQRRRRKTGTNQAVRYIKELERLDK